MTLRNVQRHHEGNYTCIVRNAQGSDHIIYQLYVQVPPDPPELKIPSVTATSVSLEWHAGNSGGAPYRGFLLAFRPEFGEWEEILLDRRSNSYLVEKLQCGTRYQFTLSAFNKIGSGTSSKVENIRTKGCVHQYVNLAKSIFIFVSTGNKPVSPQRQHLIRPNVTSVSLDLSAWQDGGCKILYFTVEFRRNGFSNDWIVVSSNVAPLTRFIIPDLEPATSYNVRITAHNNAGATIAEYYFETLSLLGTVMNSDNSDLEPSVKSLFIDSQFTMTLLVTIIGILATLAGLCFCFRFRKYFCML